MSIIDIPYIFQIEGIKNRCRKTKIYDIITVEPFEIKVLNERDTGKLFVNWKNVLNGTNRIRLLNYFSNTIKYEGIKKYHTQYNDITDGPIDFFMPFKKEDLETAFSNSMSSWIGGNPNSYDTKMNYNFQTLYYTIDMSQKIFNFHDEGLDRINEDDLTSTFKNILSTNKINRKKDMEKQVDNIAYSEDGFFLQKNNDKKYAVLVIDTNFEKPFGENAVLSILDIPYCSMSHFSFPIVMLHAIQFFLQENNLYLNHAQGNIYVENITPEMYNDDLSDIIQQMYKYMQNVVNLYMNNKGIMLEVPNNYTISTFNDWFLLFKNANQDYIENTSFQDFQIEEKKTHIVLKQILNSIDVWSNAILNADYAIKNNLYIHQLKNNVFNSLKSDNNYFTSDIKTCP